jgi:hypothetical protein
MPIGLMAHGFATQPTSGGRLYVVVEVSIENLGQASLDFSPAYFRLTDASSATYPAGAPGTNLPAQAAPSGHRAQANVAFDVPTAARGLTLSYEPTPVPSGYQTIRISLGR